MKVALVGFGRMGEARAGFYLDTPGIEVAAVIDPEARRRQWARQVLPDIRTFGHLGELDLHVEIIDLCSPPHTHEPQTGRALEVGCHVICEKPAVLDPVVGIRLLRQARAARRVIFPCHNYLHSPVFLFHLQTLTSGALGSLASVHIVVQRTGSATGIPEWMPDWRQNPELAGGGILMDHGVHCIYMVRHLMGAFPLMVSCSTDSLVLERTAGLTLFFPRGRRAHVDLSWDEDRRSNRMELRGDRGISVVEGSTATITTGAGTRHEQILASEDGHTHVAWFRPLFERFRALVTQQETAGADWLDAIGVADVLAAAYRSASRNGDPVYIRDQTVSDHQFTEP